MVMPCQQHRRDEEDVEQHGCASSGDETAPGVQHARKKRRARHEQDVGERDAPELHGKAKAFVTGKARGHGVDQNRHRDDRDHRDQQHRRTKAGECVFGKA
ncbi:hypothetical protein GALL_424610 [mine drainage metagenome]|uniref:Uncharacterized protein n=1 Tax=mine drainage metagenome TaxID=410659 RepID=A0A1J5PXT4_9ZZZZ